MRSRLGLDFGQQLRLEPFAGEFPADEAQALIVAQDVNRILGNTETIDVGEQSLEEAVVSAKRTPSHALGTLVVRRSSEGRLLLLEAVVYDFSRAPHTSPENVFEALVAAFEEARRRRLEHIALQPLGTAHTGLEPAVFVRLLVQVCYSTAELGTSVRRVHLLLPSPQELARYERLLQAVAAEQKDGRGPAQHP